MLRINHVVFIKKIINIQKAAHLKVKFQHFFPHVSIFQFFQKVFHFTHDIQQSKRKSPQSIQFHISFTLPLQFQKLPVTFFKCPLQFFMIWFHQSFYFQKIILVQHCTIHFASAFHKIMRLIDQKDIFPFVSLTEKSSEIHHRIKHIIIITDNRIYPCSHIQTHFIGTNLILFAVFHQHISVKTVFLCEKCKYSLIYSVKMTFRTRTPIRPAFHLLADTHFLFCGKNQYFTAKPLPLQNLKGIPDHCSRNRFRCQIKNFL